jgi:Tol biopolymer transport system component
MRFAAKLVFLVLLLSVSLLAADQIVAKGAPIAVTMPEDAYMAPVWSPDGSQLAVTHPGYVGIYLVSFPTGDVTTLTQEIAAGFGMAWAPQGDAIAARVARYANRRRLNQVVVFTLDGERRPISEELTMLPGVPRYSPFGDYVYMQSSDAFRAYPADPSVAPVYDGSLTYIRQDKLFTRDLTLRSEVSLTEHESRIVAAELSPNGEQLVYATEGQYLWIANADGSDRRQLARGTAPVWSPDGSWIAYMLTADDGHSMTGSDIFIISRDGNFLSNLTNTQDRIEMNPDWSPDGNWIAYDELGRNQVFVQQVEVR